MVKLTPGYVGADIHTLCKEASIIAVQRIIEGSQQSKPRDDMQSPHKNQTIDSVNVEDHDSDEDIQDLENIFIEVEDF
jgi:SpoVK/Ycf46/Vps4 family AAA+-type ATPase